MFKKKIKPTHKVISKLCQIGNYQCVVEEVETREGELRLKVYSDGALFVSTIEDLEVLHTGKSDLIGIHLYDLVVNGRVLVPMKDLRRCQQPIENCGSVKTFIDKGQVHWQSCGSQTLVYRFNNEKIESIQFEIDAYNDLLGIHEDMMDLKLGDSLHLVSGEHNVMIRQMTTRDINLPKPPSHRKEDEEISAIVDAYTNLLVYLECPQTTEAIYCQLLAPVNDTNIAFAGHHTYDTLIPLAEDRIIKVIELGLISKVADHVSLRFGYIKLLVEDAMTIKLM